MITSSDQFQFYSSILELQILKKIQNLQEYVCLRKLYHLQKSYDLHIHLSRKLLRRPLSPLSPLRISLHSKPSSQYSAETLIPARSYSIPTISFTQVMIPNYNIHCMSKSFVGSDTSRYIFLPLLLSPQFQSDVPDSSKFGTLASGQVRCLGAVSASIASWSASR